MGLPKRMRLQWLFKHIIANTNYRQSICIIGSPYSFNTAIIVTQSSIFTVHANQEHKIIQKLLTDAWSYTLTIGCNFMFQDEQIRSWQFFTVARSDSGTGPPLLFPCSEKVETLWGSVGDRYNKIYLRKFSVKLKRELRSTTRNNF